MKDKEESPYNMPAGSGTKGLWGAKHSYSLKVNQAGVIPVIFAMSILMFPTTIAGFFK